MAELVEIIGTLYEMEVLKWKIVIFNFIRIQHAIALENITTAMILSENYKTPLSTYSTLVQNFFLDWSKVLLVICLFTYMILVHRKAYRSHCMGSNINGQGVNKEFASARAEKIFEQLDEDGNGELSEEEFCRCADNWGEGGPSVTQLMSQFLQTNRPKAD